MTIKDAADQVMAEAYAKASSGGTLPAAARQIYYAARPEILRLTGEDSLNSVYFTQRLLPPFIDRNPDLTADWDITYDSRGCLVEPHTRLHVPLGTLDRRAYQNDIANHHVTDPVFDLAERLAYPTCGPANRWGAILFVEKQGFQPLLEHVRLAEKWDIGIMTTKGISNVAARELIDGLNVPVLVAHDFDEEGLKIFATLRDSTARYEYTNRVDIVDIGLRLEDVEEYDLPSERTGKLRHSPKILAGYGATPAEIEFLRHNRVELNAFSSGDLISWLERKLTIHGIKKIIPDNDLLREAYRRTVQVLEVGSQLSAIRDDARERAACARVPRDLGPQVRKRIAAEPTLSWDQAVAQVVRERYKPRRTG